MVKIIIELDENYIEEKVNVNNLVESTDSKDAMHVFADMVSFMLFKQNVEKGQTEFFLSRELLDNKEKDLFDRTIAYMVTLSCAHPKNNEKGEE